MEISLLILLYIINYYHMVVKCTFVCLYPSVLLNSFISFNSISIERGGLWDFYIHKIMSSSYLIWVAFFSIFARIPQIEHPIQCWIEVERADILVCWSDLRDKAFSPSPLVWYLLWSNRCLFIRMRQLLWICC